MKKEGDKHHYIPKFYLRQWTGEDGLVCEFSKPYKTVKPKRVHPDGTGYERGLYTFNTLRPQLRDFIERRLLQMADDGADRVLRLMLANEVPQDEGARSNWSRFLMSLLHRNPESLAYRRELVVKQYPEYLEAAAREVDQGARADEKLRKVRQLDIRDYEDVCFRLLGMAIDNANVGAYLNNMLWRVFHFRACP